MTDDEVLYTWTCTVCQETGELTHSEIWTPDESSWDRHARLQHRDMQDIEADVRAVA